LGGQTPLDQFTISSVFELTSDDIGLIVEKVISINQNSRSQRLLCSLFSQFSNPSAVVVS